MSDLQPLSSSRHAKALWCRFRSHEFARRTSVVPLVAAELPRVLGSFPIAFSRSAGSGYSLSAVLGMEPQQNLFVRPDGRWRSNYVPAYLRAHPFYLAEAGEGRRVVAVDESSELIGEGVTDGEELFDAEGKPRPVLQEVVDFLNKLSRGRTATDRACRALAERELLEPWPLRLEDEKGSKRDIAGLYRVREDPLRQLDAKELAAVRDAGALHLAYTQLVTQSHMRILSQLAQVVAREQARYQPASGLDFKQIFGDEDELKFDWDD